MFWLGGQSCQSMLGIEGTFITKGGFAHYDVINFTYPDERIGGSLDTKFWFAYVRSQNQLPAPGEDNPHIRGIRILLIMRKLVKNCLRHPSAGFGSKLAGRYVGRGEVQRRFGSLLGRDIRSSVRMHGCPSCYLTFHPCELWADRSFEYNAIGTFGINGQACMSKVRCTRLDEKGLLGRNGMPVKNR